MIDTTGATAGSIPSPGETNDLLVPLFGAGTTSLDGYFGANITGTGPFIYTFHGFEAGFQNSFSVGGNSFSTEDLAGNLNASAAGFDSFQANSLDFLFTVLDQNGVFVGSVANGANNDNTGTPEVNFFASCGAAGVTECDVVYLFLDDTGADDDDNHDDMVISVRMAPEVIPLPAGFVLLGTALGGLGLARRFRKS